MSNLQDEVHASRERIWRVMADAIRSAIETGLPLPRNVYVGPDGLVPPLLSVTLDLASGVLPWARHLGITAAMVVRVYRDDAGITWRRSTVEHTHPRIRIEAKERVDLDEVPAEAEADPYPTPRTTPGPGQWTPIEPDPIAAPPVEEPQTHWLNGVNHNGVSATAVTLHSVPLTAPVGCPSCGEDPQDCACTPARSLRGAR